MTKKVGILGGTFNPVHLGHLILAQTAAETHEMSTVLLIPCASPPHKSPVFLAPAEDRLAMVQAAAEGSLLLDVCDIEIQRGGVSYAIDTVRHLKRVYGDAELLFIIGSDTLCELHQWRGIYDLLPLCRFVTFGRAGMDVRALRPEAIRLDPPWPERLLRDVSGGRLIDISSSDIRYRVAEGMSIRYLVPSEVEMYIAEHRLYCR